MNDAFAYRDGALCVEGLPLAGIVEAIGTPTYVYSAPAMRRRLDRLTRAFAPLGTGIYYAVKANDRLAVIRTLVEAGTGAEIVSVGELRRALAAGAAPGTIAFAGVGKTPAEMAEALEAGIGQFNVESLPELIALSEIASARGRRAPTALRVNPDVAAGGHAKISTGKAGDKFGIDHAEASAAFALAARLPGIEVVGLHLHIGSQVLTTEPFVAACARAADLVRELRAAGHAIRRLDLGGGFGVPYREETEAFDVEGLAREVGRLTRGLNVELAIEPGRYLVAEAGVLLARVVHVKETAARRFVILDAGMNDLIRPALYDAHHAILPLREPPAEGPKHPVTVVGPICESADVFAADRPLPPLAPGDAVAFACAGAYGAVMASAYNGRTPPAEIMVEDGRWTTIVPRRTPDELFASERLPKRSMPTNAGETGAVLGRAARARAVG